MDKYVYGLLFVCINFPFTHWHIVWFATTIVHSPKPPPPSVSGSQRQRKILMLYHDVINSTIVCVCVDLRRYGSFPIFVAQRPSQIKESKKKITEKQNKLSNKTRQFVVSLTISYRMYYVCDATTTTATCVYNNIAMIRNHTARAIRKRFILTISVFVWLLRNGLQGIEKIIVEHRNCIPSFVWPWFAVYGLHRNDGWMMVTIKMTFRPLCAHCIQRQSYPTEWIRN